MTIRPSLLVALYLTIGIPAVYSALTVRDHDLALRLQGINLARVRGDVTELRDRPPVRDPDMERRLAACEAKLADVRHVLEVLIRTEQAGRARWRLEELPRPMSDWRPWPCRGEAIGSITEKRHPCTEGARR